MYWGVEHESTYPDKRFVAKAFLQETNPPWRKSTSAIRFRVGRKELHIGFCVNGEDPETLLYRPESDPDVVREWQGLDMNLEEWVDASAPEDQDA